MGSFEPRRVDLVGTVTTSDVVTSPLSGTRAAFVHIELLERQGPLGAFAPLGSVVLGDVVSLAVELDGQAARVDVLVRRAEIAHAGVRDDGVLLQLCPSELVPILIRARGHELRHRECAIRAGDKLRLRAVVERVSRAGSAGEPAPRFVAREERGPVVLTVFDDDVHGAQV